MWAGPRRRWLALRKEGLSGAGLLAVLLAAPAGLFVLLRRVPGADVAYQSPAFHLVAVSAIAACAIGVAVFAVVAAARMARPPLVLLALACAWVGLLLLGHGLTTPGVFGRPPNLWIGRLPVLALAGFAALLSLSMVGDGSRALRPVARRPRAVLVAGVLVIAGLVGVVAAWPSLGPGGRPFPGEELWREALIVSSGVSLLVLGAVHWHRWRIGRDRVELALTVACWLSVDAVVSLRFGPVWHLSWWDYHAYLLAGFGAVVCAVVLSYLRTRDASSTLATVSLSTSLERITHGSPEVLHVLAGAVEAKDLYTHGHSARVAELSLLMGERLRLRSQELRTITQGALLHDIGKIGVRDDVLNKPGR